MTINVNTIFILIAILVLIVVGGFIFYIFIDRKIKSISVSPSITTDLYMSIDKEIENRIKINLCNKDMKSDASMSSSDISFNTLTYSDDYTIGDQTAFSV